MASGGGRATREAGEPGSLGPEPVADSLDRERTRAAVLGSLFEARAEPARRLAGRFEVLEHLGAGAMGDVVLAHDVELDRRVAVKRLVAHGKHDARRRQRLLREARALAQVMHPNVVAIFDVESDGDDVLLAMEYVEGMSLRRWLESSRGWRELADAFSQAAAGLAAVHRAGLVHRDVKPDNLLVGDDGVVRVADLGLARLEPRGDQASTRDGTVDSHAELTSGAPTPDHGPAPMGTRLTRAGALVGTPVYMAPELLGGAPAHAGADQFALGVSLHEALFGRRPFAGDTVAALADAIASGLQTHTAGRRGPRWLVRIVARMIDPEPAHRFASMDDVARALDPARRRRRLGWWAGGVAVAAVVGTTITVAALPDRAAAAPDEPCTRATASFDDVWSPARAEALTRRLEATVVEPTTAAGVGASVSRRAQAFTEAWLDEHQRACRATFVERVQSEDDFGRRLRCLARGRTTLQQLLSGIETSDADALQRLPGALSNLRPPTACAAEALIDEPFATGAAEVLVHVDRARAQWLSAAFDDATQSLDAGRDALAGRDDDAARAEIAFGRAEVARGLADTDAATAEYLHAAELAEASRHDHLAALAWLRLVSEGATSDRDAERAEFYLARARAAVARLDNPPRLAAALRHQVGQGALAAGEHTAAVAALGEARALYVADDADALVIAPVDMDLGRAQYQRGAYGDAAETFAVVAATYETVYGSKHPRVASALNNLGSTLVLADRLDEAEVVLQRALEIRELHFGHQHAKVAQTLNGQAGVHLQRGDLEAALAAYREALEIGRAVHGPQHRVLAAAMANVGRTLSRLGRHEKAVEQLEATVKLLEDSRGPAHPEVADALHGLAAAKVEAGRPREALPAYRRALEIRTSTFGDDASKTAETGVALAEALQQAGQTARATEVVERWLPPLRRALGPEHDSVRVAERTRAEAGGGQKEPHG